MTTKRILIVDDEERIREVVRACLEDLAGWEAIVAESGQEGLVKAASEQFDAILLDVSMPDMDGFTLFQHLQANPHTCLTPVILLTAKVLPSDRAKFAQMGVAGVITKPFDPVKITLEMAEILGWESGGVEA
ncbi:MAG: response regulator [Cyanobacteria bacterium CRU_2_1]|nr:response regulator [Cyanobacteria bacterium RU_5_0]NJR62057.1 response regulator [Cyanobacteria bacterium CRU_2_1]